ncbi:prolyl oligopeptidase family serine peptidase [Bordetella sp. BOR01]|nr:prolyl oligopeptidase family serine peptidase [Bordetella sp. BOR01]
MSAAQARARLGLLGLARQIVLPRGEGLRDVRLDLIVPAGPPPAVGWPVLYLLDGNATLQALADAGERPAAVLVGIGYDIDARLDVQARAWDYTPRPPGSDGQGAPDPRQPGRRNGGADAWLDLIQQRVKPLVQAAAPVDTARQTLYGHSYGGLFVLHALRTQPQAFQRYVAASPSLWWHAPHMAERLRELDTAHCCTTAPRQLYLWVGGSERSRPERAAPHRVAPAGSASARALASELDGKPGLTVHYRSFPGLGHGAMLPASAREAARIAGRP